METKVVWSGHQWGWRVAKALHSPPIITTFDTTNKWARDFLRTCFAAAGNIFANQTVRIRHCGKSSGRRCNRQPTTTTRWMISYLKTMSWNVGKGAESKSHTHNRQAVSIGTASRSGCRRRGVAPTTDEILYNNSNAHLYIIINIIY